MAIAAAATKTDLAARYAALATHGALATAFPTGTSAAGTEPAGGSPAYARKPLTWVPGAAGVTVATVTFDVPGGTTVTGTQTFDALTGGTYIDGKTETSVTFPTQDTVTVTYTYTQV